MDLQLATPDEFPAFPYKPPYDIQTSLMRHLYESIEQKKVTIVESPTGTVGTFFLIRRSLWGKVAPLVFGLHRYLQRAHDVDRGKR
jgi:hypothetical protein